MEENFFGAFRGPSDCNPFWNIAFDYRALGWESEQLNELFYTTPESDHVKEGTALFLPAGQNSTYFLCEVIKHREDDERAAMVTGGFTVKSGIQQMEWSGLRSGKGDFRPGMESKRMTQQGRKKTASGWKLFDVVLFYLAIEGVSSHTQFGGYLKDITLVQV